jgi:hypothetical protein
MIQECESNVCCHSICSTGLVSELQVGSTNATHTGDIQLKSLLETSSI